jgi:hypothetical protein
MVNEAETVEQAQSSAGGPDKMGAKMDLRNTERGRQTQREIQ